MKNFVRVFVLVGLSLGVLYCMQSYGLIDLSSVRSAFTRGKKWIFLVLLAQGALAVAALLRYTYLIRVFGIEVKLSHVTAATFVSNAVGQWAPGSLAIIELLRVGLMLGADQYGKLGEGVGSQQDQSQSLSTVQSEQTSAVSLKAKLAIASLFDRMIGFFTMLLLGSAAAFQVYFQTRSRAGEFQDGSTFSLVILGASSLAGAVAIGILPFLAQLPILGRWLVHVQKVVSSRVKSRGIVGRLGRAIVKFMVQLQALQLALKEGCSHVKRFVVPSIMSAISLFLGCLAIYFSGLATGFEMSFSAIVSAFPIIAIASLLPIGFGGVGGQQLVAVGIFSLFSLRAAEVAAASLLQNALLLAMNSFLGLVFLRLSAAQIRAILLARRYRRVQTGL